MRLPCKQTDVYRTDTSALVTRASWSFCALASTESLSNRTGTQALGAKESQLVSLRQG